LGRCLFNGLADQASRIRKGGWKDVVGGESTKRVEGGAVTRWRSEQAEGIMAFVERMKGDRARLEEKETQENRQRRDGGVSWMQEAVETGFGVAESPWP